MGLKTIFHRHKAFLIGICFAVITIGGVLILGILGWPGTLESCAISDSCYCEHMNFAAIVRQPVNTWSNLFATCLGLIVLWGLDKKHIENEAGHSRTKKIKFGTLWRKNIPNEPDNPMRSRNSISILYGIVMIFVGTGSMYFHASGVFYGGLIDLISMQTFVSFLLVYNLQRLIRFSDKWFWGIWISLNIFMGVTVKMPGFPGHIYFNVLVFTEIGIEPVLFALSFLPIGLVRFRRDWKLYLLSFAMYFTAFMFWINSTEIGTPLCFPDWPRSLLQGHAFWHYFAALATLVIYLYMKTETQISRINEGLN
ncbi:MAG: ceramidase domain-containing protein [Promethearchaeota archaeon]